MGSQQELGYQSLVSQEWQDDVEESFADVSFGSESKGQAPVVSIVVYLVPPVSGEEHHVSLVCSHVNVWDPTVVRKVIKSAEHGHAVPSGWFDVRSVFRMHESPCLRVADLEEPVTDRCLMKSCVILLPFVKECVMEAAVHWNDIVHCTTPAF